MRDKGKGTTRDAPNKQGGKKNPATKPPSVTEASVNPGADRHEKRLILICLLLTIAAFIAFWQVTRSDFINLDDASYVTENRQIQDGLTLDAVLWAFTTGHAGYWHPLTWISHMVDVQLFGLTPGWHHFTNLLFHVASTLLLFLGLHRMTKALWQSAFVAALFALHPLHVESVAWVAERKDVLSTFFWMLTMAVYASYVARQGLARYLTLLLCFTLGLMAKPMLVTLPFVLLLLDYWPLQRLEQKKSPQEIRRPLSKDKTTPPVKDSVQTVDHWQLIRPLLIEKIPLFALTVLFSIVTYLAQRHGGAVASLDALPPSARVANAVVSCLTYVFKMLWPANLAVFYPHPGWWPLWQVLGSIVLLIAVTVLAIRGAKNRPYVTVGWLWYVGTLVPVIGLVQVGGQALADRFTYIPLVGLFIIVAWAVPELLKKWPYRKEALIASSAVCLVCLFLVTWRQVGYWQNSIALYDHAVEVADSSSLIHNSRGVTHTNLGNYNQAIADFNRAIEINPQYGEAYYNRGIAYKAAGNYTQAIADFNKAIEINPMLGETYYNRGTAYSLSGNYTQAIADFSKAIEINPQYGEAYNNRGVAYKSAGNYTQAIADFNKAIEINRRYGEAYYNRGVAYGLSHNYTQAITDFNKAIQINPQYGEAYYNRGVAYGLYGNYNQAITDFNKAIQINPQYGEAYYSRGVVYGSIGNRERALDDIRTAARLGHDGAKSFLRGQGAGS